MYKLETNHPIAISKVWAQAWVDYLFYDTDLFYSVLQNKNYELPNPPIQYTFTSGPNDPMLAINLHHAYLIRRIYTSIKGDEKSFLADKDIQLLEDSLLDKLDHATLANLESQSNKIVQSIILQPEYWLSWLNLFDDENIYEVTVPNEDNKKQSQSVNMTVREISSVQHLSNQQRFQEGVFDPSSQANAKREWGSFE